MRSSFIYVLFLSIVESYCLCHRLVAKLCPGKNTRVGCHFPLQGNLPNPGTEPRPPVSPALAGGFFHTEPPGKPTYYITGGFLKLQGLNV